MQKFDFVSGAPFRASLEADYRELELAKEAKAWKAVHVLAGSIIEAILADYLIASGHTRPDPLTMSLNDIINTCKKENIISEKTANLSHVIRSYRNLIHPGRSVREGETADENGATIAEVLVKIIVEEISVRKRANYGYTAEQIIAKIKGDSLATAILEDLLKNTKEPEIERLLLEVIPAHYFDLQSSTILEEDLTETLESLEICFRLSLEHVSTEIKGKVQRNFVRLLKEESRSKISMYENAFFKSEYMLHLSKKDRDLVKRHLFSTVTNGIEALTLKIMKGIGPFLEPDEAAKLTDEIIQTLARGVFNIADIDIREYFKNECVSMTEEAQNKVSSRIDDWISLFDKDNFQSIGIAQGLKGDIEKIINSTGWEDALGDLDDHPF